MQTTKFYVVLTVLAVLAGAQSTVAAPDTEAEAKMREALRRQMEQLNSATATPAPAPPQAQPAPAKPAATRPPTTQVVPVPRQPDPAPAAQPTTTAKPVKSSSKTVFSEVPETNDDKEAARLRDALRQQLAVEQPTSTPVVVKPVKPTPTQPAAPAAPEKSVATTTPAAKPATVTPPVATTPPPTTIPTAKVTAPLAGSKEERLAELLRRYRADAITPLEYHTQRAKILAEK